MWDESRVIAHFQSTHHTGRTAPPGTQEKWRRSGCGHHNEGRIGYLWDPDTKSCCSVLSLSSKDVWISCVVYPDMSLNAVLMHCWDKAPRGAQPEINATWTRSDMLPQAVATTASLHHELGVSFSTCDYHIHPDPHCLRGRSDHVVDSVVSLHAEG